jgi:steroid delta-isomerase-like uncharacterized protein
MRSFQVTDSQSPKGIVKQFYASYNGQDVDIDAGFERFVAVDAKNHAMGGRFDRNAWLDVERSLLQAFADFSMTILDQIAEGNKVATRWIMKGTQRSEFFGVPSNGRTAELTGTAVDLVQDAKITDHWLDIDLGGFLQQLAFVEEGRR